MSITDVSAAIAPSSGAGGEMQQVFQKITNIMQEHEVSIRSGLTEGLSQKNAATGIPDYMRKQFEVWDKSFTKPEDLKLIEEVKARVSDLALSNDSYIRSSIERKTTQFQLELAMRAANKTTSGIQTLLSAQ